jgi:hypothetical protein
MKEEKEYFLLDTKKGVLGKQLTDDELKLQKKMLLVRVILLIDICTILLLSSYVISYWGGR